MGFTGICRRHHGDHRRSGCRGYRGLFTLLGSWNLYDYLFLAPLIFPGVIREGVGRILVIRGIVFNICPSSRTLGVVVLVNCERQHINRSSRGGDIRWVGWGGV